MSTTVRPERGAATLPVVACLGLLLVLTAALGVVAAMVTAHRVAQAAADLAALGGAAALARGEDGCVVARGLAADNGARLAGCRVEGHDVLVTVRVAGPRWLGFSGDLGASARAGPGAPAATSALLGRGLFEQQVEQGARGVLVQRVVLVAALR